MFFIKGKRQAVMASAMLVTSMSVIGATQHTYQNTLTVGTPGYDMAHAAAYDKTGNLYYTGHVASGADVDPTAGIDVRTTTVNSVDALLTKINADGSYAWSRVFGGAGFDRGSSVVTDNNGNVYLAGQFSGSVDFNPGGVADVHTSANTGLEYDNFVTKINADGSYGWTRVLGGYFYIFGRTIDVDSQGNVYVAAAFSIPQDFALEGAGDVRTPVAGSADIALTKINADGSYAWTHTMGSTGYDMGHSVTVDANDNVYFTGHFVGTVDLDPTANVANFTSDSNSSDVFVMKFDANDTYQWTKTFGGPGWDGPYAIDNDDAGNVYVSGLFAGTSDLDPTAGIALSTTTGPVDIYVTKLNADGSFAWAQTMGEASPFYYSVVNWGSAMAVDGAGNVFVSRCFVDSMDFDPTAAVDLRTSMGAEDIFVTQLNTDGTYGWTATMGGATTDCANAVATSAQGDLAVLGNYTGMVDFNPAVGEVAISQGGMDIFISQFKASVAPIETLNIEVTRVKYDSDDNQLKLRANYSFDGQLDATDVISGSINGVTVASAVFADFVEDMPGKMVFDNGVMKIKLYTDTGVVKFEQEGVGVAQYNLSNGVNATVSIGETIASDVFAGTVYYDD